MSEFLRIFSGVGFPHHIGDRITRDEVHHQKDDECHPKQRWDQEQQATQEIFSHSMPVLDYVDTSLIIVTLPQYQGATQMERRNAPQALAGLQIGPHEIHTLNVRDTPILHADAHYQCANVMWP